MRKPIRAIDFVEELGTIEKALGRNIELEDFRNLYIARSYLQKEDSKSAAEFLKRISQKPRGRAVSIVIQSMFVRAFLFANAMDFSSAISMMAGARDLALLGGTKFKQLLKEAKIHLNGFKTREKAANLYENLEQYEASLEGEIFKQASLDD